MSIAIKPQKRWMESVLHPDQAGFAFQARTAERRSHAYGPHGTSPAAPRLI